MIVAMPTGAPTFATRFMLTCAFFMTQIVMKAVPVVMSAIRANINLYRPTFSRLARNPNAIKHADELWQSVESMRGRIAELLRADKANVQNIAMS